MLVTKTAVPVFNLLERTHPDLGFALSVMNKLLDKWFVTPTKFEDKKYNVEGLWD
jgi:hypothetical protein